MIEKRKEANKARVRRKGKSSEEKSESEKKHSRLRHTGSTRAREEAGF